MIWLKKENINMISEVPFSLQYANKVPLSKQAFKRFIFNIKNTLSVTLDFFRLFRNLLKVQNICLGHKPSVIKYSTLNHNKGKKVRFLNLHSHYVVNHRLCPWSSGVIFLSFSISLQLHVFQKERKKSLLQYFYKLII